MRLAAKFLLFLAGTPSSASGSTPGGGDGTNYTAVRISSSIQ